jgi:2-polyprenyl-6-methoxyphenol hydroxylase-like FAD-dependent oxidoreductase
VTNTDVVVIGAGPVGLMLVCELRLAGVDVLAVERREGPSRESRAVAFHARTAELFASRGILDRFLATGTIMPTGHFALLPTRLDFGQLDTHHGYQVIQPQSRTEEILEGRAVELGARIHRGRTAVSVTQYSNRVIVEMDNHDIVTARWVVGCDGSGSIVRSEAGIAFPGTGSTATSIVADLRLAAPPETWTTHVSERGALLLGPLGDGFYRAVIVDPRYSHIPPRAPVTLDETESSLRHIAGTDFGVTGARWLSRFGNAARQAETYRSGRILLAGDAAHIHPPIGAQGLSTGMQDAANLGWKLAASVRGWGTDRLLDTYHAERHPAVAAVLGCTILQSRLLDFSTEGMALRDRFARLLRFSPVNRYIAGQVSALDVAYARDPHDHGLVGRRLPDIPLYGAGGPSHLYQYLTPARLLLLDQSASMAPQLDPAWGNRLTTVTARCPDLPVRAVLVRPDGHIAWAGDDPNEAKQALRRWLGDRSVHAVPGSSVA